MEYTRSERLQFSSSKEGHTNGVLLTYLGSSRMLSSNVRDAVSLYEGIHLNTSILFIVIFHQSYLLYGWVKLY